MMEESDYKKSSSTLHYCKICNRGFGCGGALGGHMRAHNIADVIDPFPEPQHQEQQAPFISDLRHNPQSNNKHPYYLRTTTSNRFVSFRSSLRGDYYGKHADLDDDGGEAKRAYILEYLRAKEIQSFEDFRASREEEDLANFLVTLSNNSSIDDEDNSKCKEVNKGLFQCKACKKVFNSHQALGGHRASHKKVKGCYAARFDNLNTTETDEMNANERTLPKPDEFLTPLEFNVSTNINSVPSNNASSHTISQGSSQEKSWSKMHECSICHRAFSSGQALGGHKRCHWLQSDGAFVPSFHEHFQNYGSQSYQNPIVKQSEMLDLNLPPSFENTNKSSTRIHLSSSMNMEGANEEPNCQKGNLENTTMSLSLHDYSNGENNKGKKIAKTNNVGKEMELEEESSPWLQVGLASTTG